MAEPLLTVRHVMQPEPEVVPPGLPIGAAIGLMNDRRIGALIVSADGAGLDGIFTERDLLRRIVAAPADWRDLPVSAWMSVNPHTIGPDADWAAAVEMMDRFRVRHLPVIERGRVIGILSTRLLMRTRADHLNQQVAERTRELRHANDELLARDYEQTFNLRAAGRYQTRLLLPNKPPAWPELQWGLHYAPLDHLGGDYYDIAHPDPDLLGFLIADASGHSIAAAMVAIMSRTAFSDVAHKYASPGQVLTEMNARLQGLMDERFVTAFYAVFDRRTRVLTYANAGHPYPLLWSAATGGVRPLGAQGFMLGIMPEEQYREKSVQLAPGDRLCFYTDGLIETRNEIGETFGTDRLRDCLVTHGAEPAESLTRRIVNWQETFRGTQALTDDVTLVVAELCG
ncbi:PP2C family protein-serine/threonine phosphatase [Gemmata sp.]|uniref:PP2C family protein-serine/threonine phosphatase n=1 Tax=Gemmata sp. TaxID=1914242 RepID=UPI003F6FE3F0